MTSTVHIEKREKEIAEDKKVNTEHTHNIVY